MFINSIMFIKLGRKDIKNISFCVYILYECYFNLGCLTHHQHLTPNTHHPSEASPPAPLRMERGVITEIPLYVLKMFSGPSSISSRLIGVTSHTTPLSIRRGAGGEASVNSVCRRRSVGSKCAPKTSVTSVCSVRERTTQRVTRLSSHSEGAFYFSQIYTEEQNTQRLTETLSQPISQNSTPNTHHPTPTFS